MINNHVLAGLALIGLLACEVQQPLPELPVAPDGMQPQVQQAVEELYQALQHEPRDPSANARLAKLLHVHDRFAAAALVYSRARQLNPDAFRLAYLHGDALEQSGRIDDAIEAFRDAAALNPADLRTQVRLAQLLVRTGQVDEGRAIYETLLDAGSSRADVLYGLAKLQLDYGEPEAATVLLNRILREHGDAGPVHYALSQAYRQRGDNDAAATHQDLFEEHRDTRLAIDDPVLQQARALRAGDQPHLQRAAELFESGNLTAAALEYEKAATANPDNAATHANLVTVYGEMRDLQRAGRSYRRAVELDPQLAQAHSSYGLVLIRNNRFAEAETVLRRAAALDQASADVLVNLGFALELQQKADEAVPFYHSGLERDPLHPLGNFLLGRQMLGQQQMAVAIDHLERSAASPSPHQVRALVALAQARRDTGNSEQGLMHLREAQAVARSQRDAATVAAIEGQIDKWLSE